MPESNSINKLEDAVIEMKLLKGPDTNMNDELIIADHINEQESKHTSFNFALRAFVSSSPSEPLNINTSETRG